MQKRGVVGNRLLHSHGALRCSGYSFSCRLSNYLAFVKAPRIAIALVKSGRAIQWVLVEWYVVQFFFRLKTVYIDVWPGNIFDLFSPTSWDFHDRLAKEYGGAVRVHGFFRVRLPEIMI